MSKEKIFPLKLPSGYHGEIPKHETPTEKYLKRSSQPVNFDPPSKKISRWERKIYDKDINQERRQFIVHPAKISKDNPDWLKSTHHYFHRGEFAPLRRQVVYDRKKYDVLGNKKIDHFAYKSETFHNRMSETKKSYPQVTPKVGSDNQKNTSLYKLRASRAADVTSKIGFNEVRENLIKRPQLKVGSLYQSNFVDTYSVN